MRRPLGQHFLFDPKILKKIVDCAGITSEDTVVEIGPGLGTMTKFLSGRAKKVIAIEIDKKLIEKLKEIFSIIPPRPPLEKGGKGGFGNVELIQADALRFPYETIKGKFKVVANIPYYITTPILFRLLEFKEKLLSMTLLLQKEVAQRITASPETSGKDYGVLSITTQLHTKPRLKFYVPKGAFSPPPEVDSAVVHFEVSPKPLYTIKDETFFLKVVKAAFSHRRKTILNSLKPFNGIKEALSAAGIDSKSRAEVLSIKDFIKLADALIPFSHTKPEDDK